MANSAPVLAARLRAVYRNLLRDLPPRSVLARPRSPLHQSLRAAYDAPPAPRDAVALARLELAEQLAAYTRAQRTHTALLERYNPGMGMDEEERVRRTARRVGLDLPEAYGVGVGVGEGAGGAGKQ